MIDTNVTVMTFNIQLGFKNGKDCWNKNTLRATEAELNEVVGIIQRTNSSIVMLQEVPLNRENTEIKNAVKYIAHKLNYNYALDLMDIRALLALIQKGNGVVQFSQNSRLMISRIQRYTMPANGIKEVFLRLIFLLTLPAQ